MADRYQSLTRTPVGAFLVERLGLPDPVPLTRYQAGDEPVTGTVVVGGGGRLAPAAVAALSATGADVHTTVPDGGRLAGLVFDASGLGHPDQLGALSDFFAPHMRSLARCARLVVLGTPPETAHDVDEHITQRALEGFTRSVGKELANGGTSQLVYVDHGAEDRIATTLTFLLSPKSAYVSGQVVRIGTTVTSEAAGLADSQPATPDPLLPLAGKVALVTGAARGIGESIARVLHRDGAIVVGVDVARAASSLQTLMAEIDGDPAVVDITAVDAPQRIARLLQDRHDGVDIVVHNAGVTRDRRLANITRDRWEAVLQVNLIAPHRLTAELLHQRLIRPNGRVVGVASIAGIAGNDGQTNYATSKAGVIGFVDALAGSAAADGITVNAVAPGFIETQMTAAMPVLLREMGRRLNSLRQGGQPVDVAETVAWFAHPGSVGVTGNVTRVCGQSALGA